MNQRHALLLATFLTTFGLILIGAVATRITTQPDTPSEEVTTIVSDVVTAPLTATEPVTATTPFTVTAGQAITSAAPVSEAERAAVEELIRSREEAYQQALNQANQQLEDAYGQMAAQNAAPAPAAVSAPAQAPAALAPVAPAPAPAPVQAAPPPASAAQTFAIGPEQAQAIALTLAPSAAITRGAELVDFQGTIAYEVILDRGTVYIDANTGAVLYDGLTPPPAPPAPAAPAPSAPSAPAAPSGGQQISAEQARAIADARTGGGAIKEIKLENEHGTLVWEVKYENDVRVFIDPSSGAILFVRDGDDSGNGGDDTQPDDNGGDDDDDNDDDDDDDDDRDDDDDDRDSD